LAHWPYSRGAADRSFVEALIRHLPTVGAYDEGGVLASWALAQFYGPLGMLQTLRVSSTPPPS
jgi:hypothetical protein